MNRLKIYIMTYLTRHLFSGVWENDVFKPVGRKILYKGKVMSDEKRTIIADDAKKYAESIVWKIIKDECAFQANIKMYKTGTKEIDTVAGRMMLYNLDILDKVLIKLQRM